MQNNFFVVNGITETYSDFQLKPSNRSFRFGDGIFETMLMYASPNYGGSFIHNLQLHCERLWSGISILGLSPKTPPTANIILNSAVQLCKKNQHNGWIRLRLTLFRDGSGAFVPETDSATWLLEAYQLDTLPYCEKHPEKIGIYDGNKLHHSVLSAIKTNAMLQYVLAAKYAKSTNLDDVILLNQDNTVAETSRANIFFVIDEALCTPPLEAGCVAGVTRKTVIDLAHQSGMVVKEEPITQKQLLRANDIFTTNAINGITPVREVVGLAIWIHKPSTIQTALKELLSGQLAMKKQ